MPGWHPPQGARFGLDVRPAVNVADGPGIFKADSPVEGDYVFLGTHTSSNMSDTVREELSRRTGFVVQSRTVADLMWDMLTIYSDPEGIDGPRPLVPMRNGTLGIWLGDKTPIVARTFLGTRDPHWAKLQRSIQHDYRNVREAALASGDKTLHRRYLGDLEKRYGIPSVAFIPSNMPVVAAMEPHTSYTDDFNRASLDANWVQGTGGYVINSNQIESTVSGVDGERSIAYTYHLSSPDMSVQIDFTQADATTGYVGPFARLQHFRNEYQQFGYGGLVRSSGGLRILRRVTLGVSTDLADDSSGSGPPQTLKIETDGSTITFYDDGVQIFQVTDTAISNNTRAGILMHISTDCRGDNFAASDLNAEPSDPATPSTGNQMADDPNNVLWYRFEGTDYKTFGWDDSHNAAHLELNGPHADPNYQEGSGSALFDATYYDHFYMASGDIPADMPLQSGTTDLISFTFWIRLNTSPGAKADSILSQWAATTNNRCWKFVVDTDDNFKWYFDNNGGGLSIRTAFAAETVSIDTWYHVGFTYDEGTGAYHFRIGDVNGVLEDKTGTIEDPDIYDPNQGFSIGLDADADDTSYFYPFDGYLDEVGVFNDILTSEEIDEIRNGTYGASGGINNWWWRRRRNN